MLLAGCQPDDPAAQWRKENPFLDNPRSNPDDILIVTCDYYPMEVPDNIDITKSDFWSRYTLARETNLQPQGVVSGFSSRQIQLWQKNGLETALIPLSELQTIQAELQNKGGLHKKGTARKHLLRNPSQVAPCPGFWIGAAQSVFITDIEGALRGYTLENNDCLFRLNCIPMGNMPLTDKMYIKIVPTFGHVKQPHTRVLEQYSPKQNSPVIFDQLLLSGTIHKGYVFCIVSTNNLKNSGTLGNVFLRSKSSEPSERIFQLALFIMPNWQTASEMKSQTLKKGGRKKK